MSTGIRFAIGATAWEPRDGVATEIEVAQENAGPLFDSEVACEAYIVSLEPPVLSAEDQVAAQAANGGAPADAGADDPDEDPVDPADPEF